VIFVDTEGLGDTEKETNNDVRIFMFAMLISSHLIFNCTGVIDGEMIKQLSLVTRMSERIRLSNSAAHSDPESVKLEEYKPFFPALTVLVRDFSLLLKDSSGNTITATDYLLNAVAHKPGHSMSIMQDNFLRTSIRESFPLLNCFVM
jgi:hypothetical protein